MWRTLTFALAMLILASAAPAQGKLAKNQVAVAIRARQFSPPSLTIKRGQTVVWTNFDDIDHTVDASDGSFASGTLKKNGSWQHTFLLPGKYPYFCRLHPREKGLVIVE
jgi:plastocyanin